MKTNRLCQLMDIRYPIVQAGMVRDTVSVKILVKRLVHEYHAARDGLCAME